MTETTSPQRKDTLKTNNSQVQGNFVVMLSFVYFNWTQCAKKEKQSQAMMKMSDREAWEIRSVCHPTDNWLSTMVNGGRRRWGAAPLLRPRQEWKSWSLWPPRLWRWCRGGGTWHRTGISRYVVHRFPLARQAFFHSAASAPLSRTLWPDIYLNRTNSSW